MDARGLQNGAVTEVLRKDRFFVFLAAGMILPAAFLLSAKLNLPHVVIICSIGLMISMIIGRAVKFTDRSVIYSIVASMVAAVIFDLAFPVDKNRFILLGDIFSTNITAPFLLYLAVLLTFFEYNAYSTGVAASFSIFSIMLGSDITLNTQQTGGLFFFATHTRDFNRIFAGLMIVEIVFMLLALQPRKLLCTSIHGRWEKRSVLVFSVLFAVLIGIGGYMFFKAYEEDFRRMENIFLRAGMRRYAQSHYVVFNKEVDLNRLLSNEIGNNRNVVVLRAESKFAPGYLRGRVYTKYRDGKWTNPEQSFQKMSFTQYEGVIAIKSFFYKGGEKPTDNFVTIYPSSRFSSDVLLVPGSGNRFDIVADRMNFSQDGILIPEEWQKDGGYTAFQPKQSGDSAYPEPVKADDPGLLYVPNDIARKLLPLLARINLEPVKDDRDVLFNLSNFLHGFTYSTDIREPRYGIDPVLEFLTNTKKGHCELFATATVMLLRRQGIPARYVTGFVCEEAHPSKRYYISRLGDAHAWAEAYLKDEGRWVLVENTPPSGIPSRPEAGFWDSWIDRMKEMAQSILADLRRGNFAKAIVDFFTLLYMAVRDFVWDPFRGLSCIVIVATAAWYFVRRRNRILVERAHVDPETAVIRNEYLRLEKLLRRKYGIPRKTGMTIGEWITALPVSDGKVAKFAELADIYMGIRFRQSRPAVNEISDFIRISKDFRKELSKT